MTVDYTAVCPACKQDALFTSTATIAENHPMPDVACSCAVDAAEAVKLAVRFLRQGLPPIAALRCLEAAA